MLVKICGITNVDDARCVEQAGADFLGCIFVPQSKRCVTSDQAKQIISSLKGEVTAVGVFADQPEKDVCEVVRHVGLTWVQLHGREEPAYVNRLAGELPGCRFLKAFGFTGRECLDAMLTFYDRIADRDRLFAFLLDGPWGGGQGRPFDWSELAAVINETRYATIKEKLFLAGGLDSQNVQTAVRMVRPMGVDVASGVERGPGRKDTEKVRTFITLAKASG